MCWLRSPLYIVKKNGKEKYYYTDEELNAARAIGEVSGEVQRNKGLGSLSADQAHDSMFVKENQKLDVLEYTQDAINLLNNLMGTSVIQRKQYIFNNMDFTQIKE